jgi:hypothetical protein
MRSNGPRRAASGAVGWRRRLAPSAGAVGWRRRLADDAVQLDLTLRKK